MLAAILVSLVAFLHFYFLILEMFMWQTPRAAKIFKLSPENQSITATLAANQGLYNGFLSVGMIWSYFIAHHNETTLYFMWCAIVAALYGAAKVNRRILFVQGLPALLAVFAIAAQA